MDRDQMAEVLERIALLLEMKGENPFKIRAYRTGADVVRNFSGDIVACAAAGELGEVKGIGDALAQKLQELATTGHLKFYENLTADYPESIFELFGITGLGPKKVKVLHDQFGVKSVADLKRVCEDGSAAKLAGFGGKTITNLLENIAFRAQYSGSSLLSDAVTTSELILAFLRDHPNVSRVSVAGSCRRSKEVVNDLDFIAASRNPQAVIADFVQQPFVQSVLASGETKSSIRLPNGLQADLRVVSNAEFPFALMYFTGSKEHNIAVRSIALQHGYSMNEYRFSPVDGAPPPPELHTEEEIYQFLGMTWVDPALRENTGEIKAAQEGTLPDLIDWPNLRGTFHNHTTASDGRNSLREMAEAARDLGLQYLGISDHSRSSIQANGLDEKRLLAQIAEIRELNKEFAPHFRLFAGSEVDIHKDGSLDYPDEILAQLDFVVASVHQRFAFNQAEMTQCIIKAIENPHVTMLGHITGRLLLERPSYDLDIPAVIEAAAATGTVIELNCSSYRMELDWRWWKFAKEKGVLCSINPDAHSVKGLQELALGVRVARKGWLTKKDVINCKPLDEMVQWLGRKKGSRV